MKKTRILLTILVTANLVTCLGLEAIGENNRNFKTNPLIANASPNQTQMVEIAQVPKVEEISKITQVTEDQSDSKALSETELIKLADARNTQDIRNVQIEENTDKSRGAKEPSKELIGEFKLSFYTPSADETDSTPNITASGTEAKPGVTVAVDPRYWEFGTEFYIEGYGYVIAEDTGSAIKGSNRIDVCVQTKEEALKNGIQYRKVWVVNKAGA